MGDFLRSVGVLPQTAPVGPTQPPGLPGTMGGFGGGTFDVENGSVVQRTPTNPVAVLTQPPPAGDEMDPPGLPSVGGEEPQEAMIKGWKKPNPNLLGVLADTLILHYGGKPVYGPMFQQQMFGEAMQGFQKDPEEAIARMRQVNPELAWRMHQQHIDNTRQQAAVDAQTRYNDFRYKDAVQERISRMIGALTPENYGVLLPRIQAYTQAKGETVDLPDVYDADALSLHRLGGVSVDDQMDNARDGYYKERRLGQMDTRLQMQGADTESRINDRNLRRGETQRHNRVTEVQGEQRLQRGSGGKTNKGTTIVQTPRGPAELSPDGMKVRIKVGDEYQIYQLYEKGNLNRARRIK